MNTLDGKLYEIPFSQGGFTRWQIWLDFPHVSVSLHFDDAESGASRIADKITAASWRENLQRGMEKALLKRVHRAFIFLADYERQLAGNIQAAFQSEELSYEIFCEIVLQKNLRYTYYELAEFIDHKQAACVEILSLAPSRTLQARQFGLYDQEG